MRRRYVILDRDGTVNFERRYLSRVDQVELLPNAAAGLRRMREAGFGLVLVTNQSGISRGFFDYARLAQIHTCLLQLLRSEGVTIDGIFVCPHLPTDNCHCRKPRTGLIERAAAELGFSPAESYVIGDKPCDIDMGRRAGAKTILVRTGYGAHYEQQGIDADLIVDDLLAAAEQIDAEWTPIYADAAWNRLSSATKGS